MRPTLLIGYGDYGVRILKNLLYTCSMRGLLEWVDSQTVGGQKQLRDLACIGLQDSSEEISDSLRSSLEAEAEEEFLRDLNNQIQLIEWYTQKQTDEDLIKATGDAATRLLDISQIHQVGRHLAMGLDVIVLCHLDSANELGRLNALMWNVMNELRSLDALKDNPGGNRVLNFIKFLDFDHFWKNDSVTGQLRKSLMDSVDNWERRRDVGEPAYSRIYLMDGDPNTGLKNSNIRVDEATVFLELLLFEDIRYKRKDFFESGYGKPILSTFGIRMGERNIGMLSQDIAAEFSHGWVKYLSGNDMEVLEKTETEAFLERFNIDAMVEKIEIGEVKEKLYHKFTFLKNKVLKRATLHPEMTLDIDSQLDKAFLSYEAELAQAISVSIAEMRETQLHDFGKGLVSAIEKDLNESNNVVPLGVILDLINKKIAEITVIFRQDDHREEEKRAWQRVLSNLKYHYKQYFKLRCEWVRQEKLMRARWAWLPFSFFLSAGIFPLITGFNKDLKNILDDYAGGYRFLEVSVEFFTHPVSIFFLLSSSIWLFSHFYLHKRIKGKQKQAEAWFIEKQRGKLMAALNTVDQEKHLFARTESDVRYSLASELEHMLIFARSHLQARRREMSWLMTQLSVYRTVSRDNFAEISETIGQEAILSNSRSNIIRYVIERETDVDRIKIKAEPTRTRYIRRLSVFPSPFADWNKNFNNVFLAPIDFIGKVSMQYKGYESDLRMDEDEQDLEAQEVLKFIELNKNFDVAHSFQRSDELKTFEATYAFFGESWLGLKDIKNSLIQEIKVKDEDDIYPISRKTKGYLLRIHTGIPAECLEQK